MDLTRVWSRIEAIYKVQSRSQTASIELAKSRETGTGRVPESANKTGKKQGSPMAAIKRAQSKDLKQGLQVGEVD